MLTALKEAIKTVMNWMTAITCRFTRTKSPTNKTKANSHTSAQAANASSINGDATAFNIHEFHLHQNEMSQVKQQLALKNIGDAIKGFDWCINELNDPTRRIGNQPKQYQERLKKIIL
jgi:cobyrinic acid a,c-diamide synthase